MRENWLIAGRIRRAHGVHGNLVVEVITDFPERLVDKTEVVIGEDGKAPEAATPYMVHSVRWHRQDWLIGIEPRLNREQAQGLRGQWLFLPPLAEDERPEGFVYDHEMIGLAVIGEDGDELGTVRGVEDHPGHRHLIVEVGGQKRLLPWIDAFVRSIDLEAGQILVEVPPGLLDDEFDG